MITGGRYAELVIAMGGQKQWYQTDSRTEYTSLIVHFYQSRATGECNDIIRSCSFYLLCFFDFPGKTICYDINRPDYFCVIRRNPRIRNVS